MLTQTMTEINARGRYGRFIHSILSGIDFVVLNAVFAITCLCSPAMVAERGRTVWLLVNVAYIPVVYLLGRSTHTIRSIQMEHVLANALKAVALHALLFVALLSFVGIDSIPWTSFALFYGICFVTFPVLWSTARLLIKNFRSHGRNFSRVVIAGANDTAMRLYEEFVSETGFGYRFMGFFCDGDEAEHMPPELYRGTLGDMDVFVRENNIDEIFCTIPGSDEKSLNHTMEVADRNGVQYYYVPQLTRKICRSFDMYAMGSMPVLSVRRNPLSNVGNRMLKRAVDMALSASFLIVSPVIFIPVALAVKLTSAGPVFFRQVRTGYHGRNFLCLKFRTMYVNDESDSRQATRGDTRVTPVGRFLRRTSIDELPQFINVLKGDMSIVGPRPHMLRHTEEYRAVIDSYMVRHLVKPGITGWAQVNGLRGGAGELDLIERRVEHDVWYVENWSLFFDVKIMIRTLINIVFRHDENAY